MGERFYDNPNPSEKRVWAGITGRVLLVILLVLLVVGGVSALVWGVSTGTAPIRGRSGAFQQQQSANNRVFQQQAFEQLNGDYTADLTKIGIAKASVTNAKNSGDVQGFQQAQQDLIGIESNCAQIATDYNAKSKFYLAKDFKTADLPEELNAEACAQ